MKNLPQKYLDKMKLLLKNEYDDFIKTYDNESYRGFRVNTLKISAEDFIKKYEQILGFKSDRISWCNTGFYYNNDNMISKISLYNAGLFYIQEPSAMSPVEFLGVQPNMKVLDLCSAPGGKTVQIACKLKNTGQIVSNDISLKRCRAILKNIEISGVTNAVITNSAPEQLSDVFGKYFDRILVDVPCSGEGMFRKDSELIKAYDDVLEDITEIQLQILESASKMIKPQGIIVYSTCTFNEDENENIIKRFLDNNFNFELLNVFENYNLSETGFSKGIGINAVRLFPHKVKGEGHFFAVLKNIENPDCKSDEFIQNYSLQKCNEETSVGNNKRDILSKKGKHKKSRNKKDAEILQYREYIEIWDKFQCEFLNNRIEKERLVVSGDSLYSEVLDLKNTNLRILRNGLYLGDFKKKEFIPAPAFLMSLKKSDFKNTISFSAENPVIYKYLRAETIEVEVRDGLYVVCLDEFPLGLLKVNGNTGKNLYNQNWRIL